MSKTPAPVGVKANFSSAELAKPKPNEAEMQSKAGNLRLDFIEFLTLFVEGAAVGESRFMKQHEFASISGEEGQCHIYRRSAFPHMIGGEMFFRRQSSWSFPIARETARKKSVR